MNREIKFRGKEVNTNNWAFGDLIQYENGDTAIFEKRISKYGYEATEICKRTKVNQNTIGQFTGLYDRNQKPIYEGDIVIWSRNNRLYLVKFTSGMFYASIDEFEKNICGGFPLYAMTDTEEDGYRCEVIGNIFDDKELLNKE